MDPAALDSETARIFARIASALSPEQLDVILAEEWSALDAIRAASPRAYDHVMGRASAHRTQLLLRVA